MFWKNKNSSPVTDVERKMFLKQIQSLQDERDEYAQKYESAIKVKSAYEELRDAFYEKRKEQDKLMKQTQDLIKEISRLKNKLEK